MIKNILIEANKYNEVKEILNNIVNLSNNSYPVSPFVDEDGITKWNVDGTIIKNQAIELLNIIDNNLGFINKDFYYLWNYIHSQSDIKLHNYAVALSHRHEPYDDMDDIRTWEILDNLIYCFSLDEEDTLNWSIPEGWKNK